MAASSSTAPHSNDNKWYDIFINHRGIDVKKTFAKPLYDRLCSIGLRAFLDEHELQQGFSFPSQIKHAISTASVHVAIFSPRYAESRWCLDELGMMLESKNPIIPVFYGVTPAEVRWARRGQKGNYAQALQNHEDKQRYDSSTIENWRYALSVVADISGFELEMSSIGEGEDKLELKLLDKVVKRLSEMLRRPALHVAQYPTGLDYNLKLFEDAVLLQQQQRRTPHIIGIVGLGGVGKTTLAKEFFNRKKSNHHRSCFLFNIRDNAAKGSLISLQRQLLRTLIGCDKHVDSVDEGKGRLIEPLKFSNALVVLDDVDDEDQVNALLPVQTHDLCLGSLVLITSRDKNVLRSSRVENSSIYKLIPLNTQHSRELFCSHAFGQSYPPQRFEYLVDKFLKSCNGLPLSLKVFGALLYGRDILEWENELASLQQVLPNKITESLKISYYALNKEEQQIFLDIACFFVGENVDTAIGIWNRSGWKGKRGFQNIINKCLVEVGSWNDIHMHDHIRDMGRDVAEVSSPRRLWRWTNHVIDNLPQPSSEITVRGIRMVHGDCNRHDEDVFGLIDTEKTILECILKRLRILDMENELLESIVRRVELPNLMWLRWKKSPHSSLPSWVPLKNLRVLRVSESLLNTLWHTEGEPQVPLQLPLCLEELYADGCVRLKSIKGLEQSTKLRQLVVSDCSNLEELPSMATFPSLEVLVADRCIKLKNIRGLAQATKLRILSISYCFELEELENMETLTFLEELWVDGCIKLRSIEGLVNATRLRILRISGCFELEELPNMKTLVSLEELWAEGCVKLKGIRGLAHARKLRLVNIIGCYGLEELPSIEALVSLEVKHLRLSESVLDTLWHRESESQVHLQLPVCWDQLWVEGCVPLKTIRGLEQSTKLLELANGCSSLFEEVSSMETFVSLAVTYEAEEHEGLGPERESLESDAEYP